MWAVGGFIWFSIKHGFPPSRETLKAWVELLPIGVLIGLVPVVDRLLRRFKLYRDLESKLRLNRDGRA